VIFAALTQCRMDKISSSASPVKKGQLRRTGRYFCIKTLLVGIQTDKMALVYYNKPANAKNTHNRRV
jgi:hypothetical protein